MSGYDPNDNPPADPNTYFTLTVQTNFQAEPLSTIINEVTVKSDISDGYAIEETDVCCWTHPDAVSGVIYVDKDAKEDKGYIAIGSLETSWAYGVNTGTNWIDAYRSLQDALARATLDCGSEIWVAEGTYYPGVGVNDTFEIPDGVEVYGGFNGTETARSQRDWKTNKTVLSGYVDGDTGDNDKVVKMGNETVIDGFNVIDGDEAGIYCNVSGNDFTVSNCKIKNNNWGISSANASPTVTWTSIEDNEAFGINCFGSNIELVVDNSNIKNNIYDGIYCNYSSLTLKNSVVTQNGSYGTSFYGINLNNPWDNPIIHNCTIAHNVNQGINFSGSNTPDIRNCILFFNNDNWEQLSGYTTTLYSCVQDPNDPYSTDDTPDGNGNIIADPNFAYDNYPYGYYHLNYGSPCKDIGDDTYVGTEEVDMDSEDRDGDGYPDMGADEITCSDTSNPSDWTVDGTINMSEFAIFSAAWLSHDPNDPVCDPNHPDYVSDPNDPDYINQSQKDNWNSICDFDTDYDVDLNDFASFCENWLWEACWRSSYVETMMMSMGMSSMSMGIESSTLLSEGLSVEPVLSVVAPEMVFPESYRDGFEDEYNNMTEIVEFLEKIWEEEPEIKYEISEDDWKEFMTHVYQWLYTVEDAYLLQLKSEELESVRQ